MKLLKDIFITLGILFLVALTLNILSNTEIFRMIAFGDEVCTHEGSYCSEFNDFEMNGIRYHPGPRTELVWIFLVISYIILTISLIVKIFKKNNINFP